MRGYRDGLAVGLAFGLPVIVLPIVAWQLDAATVERTVERLSLAWACGGILAGLLYQTLRALRFALLIERRWTMGLIATICLQGTARKLLPAWLGEGAVVWLFHRRHDVTPGSGGTSLLVARAMDLAIVGVAVIVLVAAGAAPDSLPAGVGAGVLLLSGVVVLALVGLALLDARLVHRTSPGWRRSLRDLLRQAAAAVKHARTLHVLRPAAIATVMMWAAMYVQHYAFLSALGFSIDPVQVLWMQLLVVPVQLLPIRGFADLGTHEAAWFAAASIVGLASSAAAVVAIGTHLLAFVAAVIYLLFALALMAIERGCGRDNGTEGIAEP